MPLEDEKIGNEQEIWSAIRYLDPDERDRERDIAVIIGVIVLLLIILVACILLWIRGL